MVGGGPVTVWTLIFPHCKNWSLMSQFCVLAGPLLLKTNHFCLLNLTRPTLQTSWIFIGMKWEGSREGAIRTRDNFTPSLVEPSPRVWTGRPLTPHRPLPPPSKTISDVTSPLTPIMRERMIVLEIFPNNQPFVLIIFTIYSVSAAGGKRERNCNKL